MVERRVIAVEGVVQGVGFRPFVHGLASACALRGSVRNDAHGVLIDVEGEADAIDRFVDRLATAPPPLAAIERVRTHVAAVQEYSSFRIVESEPRATGAAVPPLVPADVATCDACLAELRDPTNRRHGHPFITCTHCGPRFTILRDVPYDRARTSMAGFVMCERCRREYEDPRNRRFHAQPISCWDCGPTLALRSPDGQRIATGAAATARAAAALARGDIVAVKGIGGYHLACDATNEDVVARLRARKRRAAKPFAVMVTDLDAARALCLVSDAEARLLGAPERPIVLLAARMPFGVAEAVAPGVAHLGVMLAYAPLHHLLLAAEPLAGRPLVMTSGNVAEEPIAHEDDDALARLGPLCDLLLTHDRPIETRADDSVARVVRGAPVLVRRSRGYAPRALATPVAFPRAILAVGGHLKNTFCLAEGRRALLSHHIGDLEHPEASAALADGIAHYARLFGIRPEVIAHDLHPEYRSTRVAERLADVFGVADRIAVQHHHAHVASCLAEHGVTEPAIGVAFDGAGLGDDGAVWGGEFLVVRGAHAERAAHLAYVPLPGGDACAREPWRAAAAHHVAAFGASADALPLPVRGRIAPARWRAVRRMMDARVASPPTSSMGRLFDAVAAIVGLHDVVAYEGQAAMALEAVADRATARSYPVELRADGDGWLVETGPLVRGVVSDVRLGRSTAAIAGAFHNAVRDLLVETVVRVARRTGIRRVALTGGVFQNVLLAGRSADALERRGFDVLLHRQVPCNDGGLALGQAHVAALTLDARGG